MLHDFKFWAGVQRGENLTYATEHCEPFYNYSTAPLDQHRLKNQREEPPTTLTNNG
jgi:hypothetical protein